MALLVIDVLLVLELVDVWLELVEVVMVELTSVIKRSLGARVWVYFGRGTPNQWLDWSTFLFQGVFGRSPYVNPHPYEKFYESRVYNSII